MGNGEASGPAMGLYALAARDMFRLLSAGGEQLASLQVYVSFFEIYGGKLFDLLNDRKKLVMREDGAKTVQIVGLRERKCTQVSDLLELMAYGNAVRSTGSTGANMDSSRSHAILQIVLKKPDTSQSNVPSFPGQQSKQKLKVHGKFSFIDLAGNSFEQPHSHPGCPQSCARRLRKTSLPLMSLLLFLLSLCSFCRIRKSGGY
jgi:kinesin family protein 2/24